VDVAAKFLVPLVIAEFLALLILCIAIVYHKGAMAFPYEAVAPSVVLSSGFGVSMMIGLASFIGVESAALYAQEARDPTKTISRATLAAVGIVAVAYFATVWVIVGDLGPSNVHSLAEKLQGELILTSFRNNTGERMFALASLMLCGSNFACYLALHNAATRYVHTLSSQRRLPTFFATAHPKNGSPAHASMATSVVVAMCISVPASMGVVPYATLLPSALALGPIGIISLQAGVSVAVIVYFRRMTDTRTLTTLVFPIVGCVGLVCAMVLIFLNYGILTGSESSIVNAAPLALVALFFCGFIGRPSVRKGTGQ
jgi:amino acid transporter